MIKCAFLAFVLCIFGCRKHESFTYTTCELCDYAKGIEGTYKGVVNGFVFFINEHYTDSATLEVQQIFLNNNTYDDSTMMYFSVTRTDNHFGSTNYDTIQINSISGNVLYKNLTYPEEYWIRNGTARILYAQPIISDYKITYDALLIKQ